MKIKAKKHNPDGLVRLETSGQIKEVLINEDLLKPKDVNNYFKKHNYFDVVIHAANVGGKRNKKDNADVVYQNCLMFFNLVKNKNYFNKIINLGSGAEYSKDRSLEKVTENEFDELIPGDYYGFSKFIIAKFLEEAQIGVNLRLFGVYGKYEDYRIRFISYVILRIIKKKNIDINKNVVFDYLYVDDLMQILEYFIKNDVKYVSYNVGVGKPLSLLTIANKIKQGLNSKSRINLKSKVLGYEYSCNNNRLLNETGKLKFSNFEDSVKNMHGWLINLNLK